MFNKLNGLFFRDSSTLQRHRHQHHQQHQQHQQHRGHLGGHSFQMAPSVCHDTASKMAPPPPPAAASKAAAGGSSSTASGTQKCGGSSLNGSLASYKMAGSEQSWPQAPVYSKENQRPPVYNPEDYVLSLRKFTKGSSASKMKSIYDVCTTSSAKEETYRSSTLPAKHSEYKSPIPAPPESDSEMSLRQFGSITDLLTKLRADLRVSFPSFVQEFVATPSDGISHLLEVLRAIQMAQASNAPAPVQGASNSLAMSRNPQSYQRRALLDELSCLQCLSICCSRSLDAIARLGNTPVGLMPLASSATGQGIRARILALQLLASACDRQPFGSGSGSQKIASAGHTAVSEAMSTLRLRCSEPVRFRLLVGILNSGGGSGELQCAGVKFLNTFIESAVSIQQRLYIQAELFQAGLDPSTLARTISSSSPWLDSLRAEVKRFNELHIDVDKMMAQARDADRTRSQMVILERRVQILHEEKAVLTSMERRLQERCAELQREIFRLQGAQQESNFKPVESHQPVALPRQVPPPGKTTKQSCSEHEDEGISSSETGASLSPVPILVLPSKAAKNQHHKPLKIPVDEDEDDAATIEDVIEELDNIVSEAEKQIGSSHPSRHRPPVEQDIVPVNIVPQPPRKSRSLAHLVPRTDCSEQEGGSDYGMLLHHPGDPAAAERLAAMQTFFDEADYDAPETDHPSSYAMDSPSPDMPEANAAATAYNASTNRELLDVIMNARHDEHDPTMQALRKSAQDGPQLQVQVQVVPHKMKPPAPAPPAPPAQQFNGVFFMTGMNTPQRYPKPDITAALQARRVTKNVERLEAAFASSSSGGAHEALNEAAIIGREKSRSNQQIYFSSNPAMRMHQEPPVGVTMPGQSPASRTRSYTQGSMSKVTDLPCGLY
ncbi:GL16160 [Drosophila persimilis]|uniref:GL16160 n=1 Tax=Drosophila persimilis TaxID=7234 RepID=B4H5J2_DROPE|nr:GL16160 [Drosophila persimilis]